MKSDLTNIMMIFFLPFAVKSRVDNHCRKNTRTKVVNSREVREVVEGTTCISDKKLSEIC